jgi:hypothetical protein
MVLKRVLVAIGRFENAMKKRSVESNSLLIKQNVGQIILMGERCKNPIKRNQWRLLTIFIISSILCLFVDLPVLINRNPTVRQYSIKLADLVSNIYYYLNRDARDARDASEVAKKKAESECNRKIFEGIFSALATIFDSSEKEEQKTAGNYRNNKKTNVQLRTTR